MPLPDIAASLQAVFPQEITKELISTFTELKSNLYLGHLRPGEVEGGRFSEAVFRILEFHTTGGYTPLGRTIDSDRLIKQLSQLAVNTFPDSIRLHIPRTLRVIYDIRNKRDAAHLGDGIDPNLQDTSLVAACCDWIMAEIVRLFHGTSADEAHHLIDRLVTRRAPVVQAFGEQLKTLRPKLTLPERLLVLLYYKSPDGASVDDLSAWTKPGQRKSVRSTLWKLTHDKDQTVERDGKYFITRAGQLFVEERRLMDLN